jgi:CubicO group peptidase (beta-lactamase class C family)
MLVLFLPVAALAADPRSARVDALFSEFAGAEAPGCAVGIAEGARLVHAAGYGRADLEYDHDLDADSVFRSGSVSKQFTAAALALAAEEGALSLDDPLGRWLPELHESVRAVTLRQVVGHVGGLPDYDSAPMLAALRDASGNDFDFGDTDHLTGDEFFAFTRLVEAVAPPETEWRYSNIGYFWLGRVVEAATGESLRDYAERRIFVPAGMAASQFNDDVRRIVPRRAQGYRPREDGGVEILETNLGWVGEGGVYTSVRELARWNDQFRAPTLGDDPAALRERLVTPVSDVAPEGAEGYAFGLEIGTDDAGRRTISHGGSWVAFRAFYRRFPDEDLAYWILCNRPDVVPAEFGEDIEAIWLE